MCRMLVIPDRVLLTPPAALEWGPSMFPVNRKVGIQGQDTMTFVDFRHANDAGICQ